jgi:predicted dehydrogenase
MAKGDLRIGIVGKRGGAAVAGLRAVPGVEVSAFCELDPAVLDHQMKEHGVDRGFSRYEDLLGEVDAVVLGTPMHLHAAQAVQALRAGRHVLSEVTSAVTMDECWRLAEAVEASGKTYMLAENYCYFEENILIRHMVRKGLFGKLVFGEGEYIHEVRAIHHFPDGSPTWRSYWQVGMPGNTYITHELGPLMQWFGEQDPANRIETVTCLGSGIHADPEHPHDDTSLTLVKMSSGALLKLRLDMMSMTPGMTYYSLQGTEGCYESGRGWQQPSRFYMGEDEPHVLFETHRAWRGAEEYRQHLSPEWSQRIEEGKESGHGGGDYQCSRLFAEAIRDEAPPDIDIYQALEWTAAGLASQASIQQGGFPVRVPNFRDPAQRPVTLDCPPPEIPRG